MLNSTCLSVSPRKGGALEMEGTDNGPQILTENLPQAKRGRTGHEKDRAEKEQGVFDSLAR